MQESLKSRSPDDIVRLVIENAKPRSCKTIEQALYPLFMTKAEYEDIAAKASSELVDMVEAMLFANIISEMKPDKVGELLLKNRHGFSDKTTTTIEGTLGEALKRISEKA